MSTIQFLDEVKRKLIFLLDNYRDIDTISKENFLSDDDFKKSIRIIKKISKDEGLSYNKDLLTSRTTSEFIDVLMSLTNDYQQATIEINTLYNNFTNFLEDNEYEVQLIKVKCELPEKLTFNQIRDSLEKCDSRIESEDYQGAITSAKTLVEGVCKEILVMTNIKVENINDSLPKLYSNLAQQLKLKSSEHKTNKSLLEITSGLNKVISGLAEIRNLTGDSHAKTTKKPSFHHAVLAVNSAKTVTSFLFHTYEYQKEMEMVNKQ